MLEKTEISLTNFHNTIKLNSLDSLFKQPVVIFDLTKLAKKNTHLLIYQEKLSNIQEKYPNYPYIYLDGSKCNSKTGYGAVFNNKAFNKFVLLARVVFLMLYSWILLVYSLSKSTE